MISYCIIPRPPYSWQPLFPLPQPSPLMLPPHVVVPRRRPEMILYRGVPLYYNGIYNKDGSLRKITITYRGEAQAIDSRHITGYGQISIKRDYTPHGNTAGVTAGMPIPVDIVSITLDCVFDECMLPHIMKIIGISADTRYDLAAPIGIRQLEAIFGPSAARRKTHNKLMHLLGATPIGKIMPQTHAAMLMSSLSVTDYEETVRLLRRLFSAIWSQYVLDSTAWARYKIPNRGRTYCAAAAVRRVYLHLTLSPEKIQYILDACTSNIAGKEGDKYLATAIMLLLGIDLEEVCALDIESIHPLREYPSIHCLDISASLQTVGELKSKTADGKKRMRARKHEMNYYDEDDLLHRRLPFCAWLWSLLQEYRTTHPDDQIMRDRRNKMRRLAPETLSDWLDSTFGSLVIRDSVSLAGKDISATYNVADYLAGTAHTIMLDYCSIPEDAVRRLQGRPPIHGHTDATNYADFQCDEMIANMSLSLDRFFAAMYGTPSALTARSSKKTIGSVPNMINNCELAINLPKNDSADEMIISIIIPFGGTIHTQYIPPD